MSRFSSGRRPARSAARDPNERPAKSRTAHPNRAASVKVTPKKDNAKPRPHGIVASGKAAKSERMPYVARRDRASTRTPDSAQSPLSAAVILSVDIGIHLQPDTVVNRDGKRVWLKEAFTSTGRRIGVGPCCLESEPCPWHKSLSRADNGGHPPILPAQSPERSIPGIIIRLGDRDARCCVNAFIDGCPLVPVKRPKPLPSPNVSPPPGSLPGVKPTHRPF